MNKKILASALVSGALMMSGSVFAQTGKAPSDTPNDTTAAPLNQPTPQGATAPAPAGSNTHGTTGSHSTTTGGTHNGTGTMGTTGTTGGTHNSGATGTSGAHNPNQGSNMQHDNANRGNAAQPSQPRPVTGG